MGGGNGKRYMYIPYWKITNFLINHQVSQLILFCGTHLNQMCTEREKKHTLKRICDHNMIMNEEDMYV